jgi:hypothetical protein
MSRIIVEYRPTISIETRVLIRKKVAPSMTSYNGTSGQYEIDEVVDAIEALGDLGNQKDLLLINDLINEGVHYIEF